MKDFHNINNEEYYKPEFYKFASIEEQESFYPLIGRLITTFNSLENEISECLVGQISVTDEIGWIVISDLGFNEKLRLWEKICNYFIEFIKDDLIKQQYSGKLITLSRNLLDYSKIRNSITHANWSELSEKSMVKTKTRFSNKKVTHAHILAKKEDFEKVLEEFDAIHDELDIFVDKIIKIADGKYGRYE
jgi:hypothetical protein